MLSKSLCVHSEFAREVVTLYVRLGRHSLCDSCVILVCYGVSRYVFLKFRFIFVSRRMLYT